jgi:gliding motility-associated-like protein
MTDSVVSLLLSANDSIVAHFIYNPKPNIVPATANICTGGTVQLQASNGLNYSWSPGTGLSCASCSNPIASPTVSTTYTVTSTASLSCYASTTQNIIIITAPPLFAAASDTKICSGETSQLQVTNGNSYTWLPAAGLSCTTCSNPIASPSVSTNYSVSSTFTNGCMSSTIQSINVVPSSVASFTTTNSGGAFPQTISVVNTSSYTSIYYWTFGTNTTTLTTPSFVVNSPGSYTITLVTIGSNNCNDTLRSIIVIDDIIQPSIAMPNIFTPNADGVNDFFYPVMVGFKEMTCLIYDRWGVLVYEFNSLTDKWSGENLKGKDSNAGTYFYIFTGIDIYNKNYLRKGYVQLIR